MMCYDDHAYCLACGLHDIHCYCFTSSEPDSDDRVCRLNHTLLHPWELPFRVWRVMMSKPHGEVRYPCCEHCTIDDGHGHAIPCSTCGLNGSDQERREQDMTGFEQSLFPSAALSATVPVPVAVHTEQRPAGRHHAAQLAPEPYTPELAASIQRDQQRIDDARAEADADTRVEQVAESWARERTADQDGVVTEIHGIPVTPAMTPQEALGDYVDDKGVPAKSPAQEWDTHWAEVEVHLKIAAIKVAALRIAAKHGTEDALTKAADDVHEWMDKLKRMV